MAGSDTRPMSDQSRYTRQTILPEFGTNGQEKLSTTHILVVGAGGLGCPVLQYLTAAGVGKISIVDDDVVSRTNLHRQILYRDNQVGQKKALAAKEILNELNPEVSFECHTRRLDPHTLKNMITNVDLVMDCADNFATTYALSDYCLKSEIPLISASVLGFNGYVGGFCGTAPSVRSVFPELPDQAASCDSAGVSGPVVGVIGSLQAQMAISHILELTPSPLGQLLTIDCRTFATGGFRFDSAKEPNGQVLGFISPNQVEDTDFIVELRDELEAPVPAHPNALRHLPHEFHEEGIYPNENKRIVLCCKTGLRSWKTARQLQSYWPGEIALVAVG